jgi:hypothetical protein
MRSPLTVTINDGYTERDVTSKVSGLKFEKTAPGGHASASCTLDGRRDLFPYLGPNDKLKIAAANTARTQWEGYTDNPGGLDGPEGQGLDIQASGGLSLTNDMNTPVVFIERSLDDNLWPRRDLSAAGASTQVLGNVLHLQFPSGIPVGPGSEVGHEYVGLYKTGQKLLVLESQIVAGQTDAAYRQLADSLIDGVYQSVAINAGFSTSQIGVSAVLGANFPGGTNGIMLISNRPSGFTNVANDSTWGRWLGPYLRPILKRADGTDETTSYLPYAVRAHEVVNHLLGALLPMFDGAAAVVEACDYWITQLTYHDGAKPQQMLDDVTKFEPDFYWGVGATGANGKHAFWWRRWTTEPRYVISVEDGYNEPGGDNDLCNRIIVYWVDASGQQQAVQVGNYVPELGNKSPILAGALNPSFSGRVRDADSVTLPDGHGSLDNAQRVGEQILAGKAKASKAATAVVRRPIIDHLTGRLVQPYEIEPGFTVRVQETGVDMRLTRMAHDAPAGSTALTLGTPVPSADERLAALAARG